MYKSISLFTALLSALYISFEAAVPAIKALSPAAAAPGSRGALMFVFGENFQVLDDGRRQSFSVVRLQTIECPYRRVNYGFRF